MGHELHLATTVQEAIDLLDRQSPFDVAYLDHDMDQKAYTPSDEKSGFWVAKHIAENLLPDKLPKHVVVHTWNSPGALKMVKILLPKVPTVAWEMFHLKDNELEVYT